MTVVGLRTLRSMAYAFAAASCMLLVAAVLAFSTGRLAVLEVTSGSMEPAISTGDMLVSRRVDAQDVQAGDVVTVPGGGGALVTHRVVSVEPGMSPGARRLLLKGDANRSTDGIPVEADTVLRTVLVVPAGGHVRAALAEPPAPYLFAACSLLLGVAAVVWHRRTRPDDGGDDELEAMLRLDSPGVDERTGDIPVATAHDAYGRGLDERRDVPAPQPTPALTPQQVELMRAVVEAVADVPLPPWAAIGMTAMASGLGLPGEGADREFSADGKALTAALPRKAAAS